MFDSASNRSSSQSSSRAGQQQDYISVIPITPQSDKKKEITADEQKSISQKRREDLYIEGFTGNDWGDKITFTVGVSYFGGN